MDRQPADFAVATLSSDPPYGSVFGGVDRTTTQRLLARTWRVALARIVRHELTAPLILLILCILPWCANFLLIYPDERFYLDAAITMHETRDLLVPRYDDGSPRLNKPLLTYWIMLASFDVLGINIFAARLPFLLAAAGLLALTWRLARLVAKERRIAQLAVWILLANPFFLLSAMRSLPDIFLALFATMAVFGYFKLRANGWSDAPAAWWLTLGLGLSFATKGLPALLLIGCIGLHALADWRQFHRRMLATLAVPVLAGLAVGIAGFAPILWSHAQETVHEIWHDQFAQRLVYKARDILHRLPLLLVGVAALHLVWLIPGLLGLRQIWRQRAPLSSWAKFLALTCLLWIAATVATENCSLRYLAPLFPWMAIVIAGAVAKCDANVLMRFSRRWIAVGLASLGCLTAVAALIVAQLDGRVVGLAFLTVVAWGVVVVAKRCRAWDAWDRLTVMAAQTPVIALIGFVAFRPIVSPDLGTQVRQSLANVPTPREPIAVLGSACHTSRVRLALASWQRKAHHGEAGKTEARVLLLPATRMDRLDGNFHLTAAATLTERMPWHGFVAAVARGKLGAYLRENATEYRWAVRKEMQAAALPSSR